MEIYFPAEFFLNTWNFILAWGWIVPPVLLWPLFLRAWLWWRQEIWESQQKYIVLEIIPPPEIDKPFKAMEQIFNNLWSIYSSLGIKKFANKWWKGRKMYYFSCEIASLGKTPHLFIRLLAKHRDNTEASIYSQFPFAEIREVRDYTENMPWHVPNKDWDMYGFDVKLIKSDSYPILTYKSFEEKSDVNREEKRIEPMNTLLEGFDKLKPEEQIWIQIRTEPTTPDESDYLKRGRVLINKLSFRDKKTGKQNEEKGFIPPEMKLTPKEKEDVTAIEDKLGKQMFKTNIRCLYFGKKDIYDRGRRTIVEQYLSSFSSRDLNAMKKLSKTKTRIYHFFIKRRLFIRKRRIFRRFLLREITCYPKKGYNFAFNTEEVASIYHLPINVRNIGTSMPRVLSKKYEAPKDLPGQVILSPYEQPENNTAASNAPKNLPV